MFCLKPALLIAAMFGKTMVESCQDLPEELVDKGCVIYCVHCSEDLMMYHNLQYVNYPVFNYGLIKNSACVVAIVQNVQESPDVTKGTNLM